MSQTNENATVPKTFLFPELNKSLFSWTKSWASGPASCPARVKDCRHVRTTLPSPATAARGLACSRVVETGAREQAQRCTRTTRGEISGVRRRGRRPRRPAGRGMHFMCAAGNAHTRQGSTTCGAVRWCGAVKDLPPRSARRNEQGPCLVSKSEKFSIL